MKYCNCGRPIIHDEQAIELEEKLVQMFGKELVGDDYDVSIKFDVQIRHKRPYDKTSISEKIHIDGIKTRLKYKLHRLGVYIEDIANGKLKDRLERPFDTPPQA